MKRVLASICCWLGIRHDWRLLHLHDHVLLWKCEHCGKMHAQLFRVPFDR